MRKALGEEQYVETVPKRGYRLVVPFREIDDVASLIVERTIEAHLVIEQEEESRPGDTRTVPLASYLKSGIKTLRILTSLAAVVGSGVAIAGVVLGLRELLTSKASPNGAHRAFQTTQVRRFPSSGNILTADGDPPKQLTDFQAGQLFSFTWSPDGQWLAYLRHTATSDVVLLRDFR